MSGVATRAPRATPVRRARSAARVWAWLPAVLYMGFIFYLSSLSDPLPILTRHVWDKALHVVEYGTLGALLLFALGVSGAGRLSALWAIVRGQPLRCDR